MNKGGDIEVDIGIEIGIDVVRDSKSNRDYQLTRYHSRGTLAFE